MKSKQPKCHMVIQQSVPFSEEHGHKGGIYSINSLRRIVALTQIMSGRQHMILTFIK